MLRLFALVLLSSLACRGETCNSFEVMICTTELDIFGSFVLDDGTPDVASICGRQKEFEPLAGNCEAEASLCDDNDALQKIAKARTDYAATVQAHCTAATATPEPAPVIEDVIVPEFVDYSRCNLNPTRLFEICGGGLDAQQTCQDLDRIKTCIRRLAVSSPGCSTAEMNTLEKELLQTLDNIC